MKHAIISGPAVTPEETAQTLGVSSRRFRELALLTGYEPQRSGNERQRSAKKHASHKSSTKKLATKSARGK